MEPGPVQSHTDCTTDLHARFSTSLCCEVIRDHGDVHQGAAGVAGDIVVTLKAPVEIAGTGIGLSMGCVRDVSKPLLRDIKRNPDQYYVNVHNTDFPGGAVRGQLEAPSA